MQSTRLSIRTDKVAQSMTYVKESGNISCLHVTWQPWSVVNKLCSIAWTQCSTSLVRFTGESVVPWWVGYTSSEELTIVIRLLLLCYARSLFHQINYSTRLSSLAFEQGDTVDVKKYIENWQLLLRNIVNCSLFGWSPLLEVIQLISGKPIHKFLDRRLWKDKILINPSTE